MRTLRLFSLFVVVCALGLAADAPSETGPSGTYRGRVLTERFRHQQAVARRTVPLSSEERDPARQDQGQIAIIDASNGVVPERNLFDLQGVTLRFTPSPDGYVSTPERLALDETARTNGASLALEDDDTTRVDLGFTFPYFDVEYTSLWVNSDGNITFGEGDGMVATRSIARAVAGPPRICAMFADLDPSRPAARVRVDNRADRIFVTWDNVPQYSAAGTGRRQVFQVELAANGAIAFHYRTANLDTVAVGVFEGRLEGQPAAVDFSAGPTGPAPGGLGELFQLFPDLDVNAAAQQFYRNHDDAYDFIVLFNSFGLSAGPGIFAFEVNVRNEVEGIGDLLADDPIFDFGLEFGSRKRLVSFLSMGPLSNYPSAPTTVIPLIGENSTLSVLGQEAGHRWGAYVEYVNPATGLPSTNLLGRADAHWNFFFNSQASVLEGNEIVDRGEGVSPRFETVDAVSRFSDLDQYIMGLRGPEEVAPSFVVLNPRNGGNSNRARQPQSGVRFDGDRQNIDIGMIVAAEGPRAPDHTVARRQFRFAFVLLVPEGAEPNATDVAKLDRIRTEWETYFNEAVNQRASAQTQLVRLLSLSAEPAAGVLLGGRGPVRIEIAAPLAENLIIDLTAEGGAIAAPPQVTIPAGATSASFEVSGAKQGVGVLRAAARTPGFDVPAARIQVLFDPSELTIDVESGAGQDGARGQPLPAPVVFSVRDRNRLPYLGVPLALRASNGGTAEPGVAVTNADGLASVMWRLPASADPGSLTATLSGLPSPSVEVLAGDARDKPAFAAAAVVNAASFNQGPASVLDGVAPGSLVSIFGAGLSNATEAAASFPLPRTLAGTSVRINGAPAPLVMVSPGQINLQVPFETAGPEARFVVESAGALGDPVEIRIAPTQPGVFADAATGLAAVIYAADGLSPWHRAARPGEFLQIFATGLGAVSPRTETGEAAAALTLSRTISAPRVVVGGRALTPSFSGLAPFFSGLYQINVRLPSDIAAGSYELSIETSEGRSNAARLQVEAP